MESKEISITYETLFELFKRERDMADLQKLEPTFFNEIVDYLKDKSNFHDKDDSLFSYEERKKVEKQIDNAKRIIKGIYDRREKKILIIALEKSRTKSDVIDTSSLLDSEKELFEEIVKILDGFRRDIIDKVMNSQYSSMEQKDNPVTKLVRFTKPVPKFVGKELEEHGPFSVEDIASLPTEAAEILVNKGSCEEIKK